jgi:hypothetical protein
MKESMKDFNNPLIGWYIGNLLFELEKHKDEIENKERHQRFKNLSDEVDDLAVIRIEINWAERILHSFSVYPDRPLQLEKWLSMKTAA